MPNRSLLIDRGTIALVALTVLCPASARAQVAVNLVVVDAHHQLFSEPLVGAGISAQVLQHRRLSVRLRADHTRGGADRTGRPCTGFIADLATCPLETMQDQSRMSIASLGVAVRVLGNSERSVAITTDLLVGHVRVDSRGTSSGRSVTISDPLVGASIGALGTWPIPTIPLALQVSGEIGALGSPLPDPVFAASSQGSSQDFGGGFGKRRLTIGVSWVR